MFSLFLWESCREDNLTTIPDHPDFNFDIRPILSENCFLCHGPDVSTREADLRLDIKEGATAILKSGNTAIVSGHPEKSELIRRITCLEEEERMPPIETKKKLTKREIDLLKKWIEQGAEWQLYWAFIAPSKTKLPAGYQGNTMDWFINEKLDGINLKPAKEADKNSLIRRLSYLLIGLPPTSEEVMFFENDHSEDAYEKLVDRLLSSSHFGERWARHWMDLVRYADTRGHEYDFPVIGAWHYRDYLIRAFNADVPYNQFIKEHLAGDLLENPRFHPTENVNESALATAFFAMGEGTHSPVDIKKDEADRIDNMIDVTSKTFQGMTLACARCHDHKFDPLPTADYYSLYGILESTRFSLVPARSGLQALALVDSIEQYKKAVRELVAGLNDDPKKAIAMPISNTGEETGFFKNNRVEVIGNFRNGSLSGWFSSGIAFGNKNALGDPVFDFEKNKITHFKKAMASSQIYGKGVHGVLRSPTFTINKDRILVRAAGNEATLRIVIDNFQLIQDPIYGGLEKQLLAEDWKGFEMDVSMWKGHKAYIEIMPGRYVAKNGKYHHFDIKKEAWVEVEYAVAFDDEKSMMNSPVLKNKKFPYKKVMKDWVNGNPSLNSIYILNKKLRTNGLKYNNSSVASLFYKIDSLSNLLCDSTFVVGVTDGDVVFSSIFIRGDHKQLGDEKQPHGHLTALDGFYERFPQKGSGRMALANAIAHPENPLTARVMVNRIWRHLFGRGIVETVDNFGLQGKLPTHPELLDHLAVSFMENGWSVKKMIRQIVLSETFKRSTNASSKSKKQDPQNLLLQHFPIRRLEAEAIRDGILATSGRLDTTMFGEPFDVYLTGFLEGRGRPPQSGEVDGDGRRSIYQTIRRNFLPQFMMAFDMPTPFSTFGKRNTSNVPAQSLALMNDPFVKGQAEFWAKRLMEKEMKLENRIEKIYLTAFARKPKKEELKEAVHFFEEQKDLNEGKEEWQIWADYCHAVFNMKEFIFLK